MINIFGIHIKYDLFTEGIIPPPPEPTYNTITSADGYILCDVNGIIISPKTT